MDLLEIGSHCSLSSCHELDFLPILCQCQRFFCRHHILPALHACPIDPTASNPPSTSSQKAQRCAKQNCSQWSLSAFTGVDGLSATCSHCEGSFCAEHRHPKSHSCPVRDVTRPQKSATARALLAKNFPPSSSIGKSARRTVKIPTDPVKLEQYRKLELMKMRHHAIAGDPKDKSPTDQRLHVRVKVDEGTEKVLWFRKTLVTGRVLDHIARHFGIPDSDSTPRHLRRISLADPEDRSLLRNDQPFDDQVEEGCTLILEVQSSSIQ